MAASPSSAKQAAEDACDTMQACLETRRDRPDASVPAPSKQRLAAAVGLLRTEVAKVGLLYGSGPDSTRPSAAEQQALLSGLQNGVGGVCMVLMGAAARGGPTLRAALGAAAGKLVAACAELVRGAVGGAAASSEAVMQLAGRCLEQCSAVEKAPLDNRTAVGRAIMQVIKTLADASRELQEIAAESAEAAAAVNGTAAAADQGASGGGTGDEEGQHSSEAEEEGEDEEDAELACEEALSAGEARVVRSVLGMLGAVSELLRAAVRALLAAEGAALEAQGGSEGWEGLLFHVKELARSAEDLAAAIYPPQDAEELAGAAEAVATGCELICDECPLGEEGGSGEGAQGEQAAAAARGLQAAQGKVQQAHVRLAAALGGREEEEEEAAGQE